MQFQDLGMQYEKLKLEIDYAIADVLAAGRYIGGPQVSELEEQLAEYVGTKYCVTCGNGTDALQLALMAWGVGSGDAVFVPDFTFFSSGEVVSAVGATPVFVDVDERTFNIDPQKLEQAVNTVKNEGKFNPRVVIAVDLFGLPADYPAIKEICKKNDLLLLEDGAQGFGGSIEGKMSCSFGDISTTSFFPAKPLGCYGDGGAIFTDSEEWSTLIRSYAVHGKGTMKYDNVRIGMNSRLDTLQAAILQVKLKAFIDYELDAVNRIAEAYSEGLQGLPLVLPLAPEGCRSSWAQYTIQLSENVDRDALQAVLGERGIPTMVYYPKPMHEQKAFWGKQVDLDDWNVTGRLCRSVLSLPMGPYVSIEEIDFILKSLTVSADGIVY